MTEPLRNHDDHGGATAVDVVQAPQWHRAFGDGGSSAEVRRNRLKVSAVPPRSSAVLTVFRGATAVNGGTTAEPRRSWRCHCGLCRTSTAASPGLRCDGGIKEMGYSAKKHMKRPISWRNNTTRFSPRIICKYQHLKSYTISQEFLKSQKK